MPVFIFKWKTRVVRGLCTEAPLSPSLNPSPSTVNGRIPSVFALSSFPGIEIRLTSFNTPWNVEGSVLPVEFVAGFGPLLGICYSGATPFSTLLCPLEQPIEVSMMTEQRNEILLWKSNHIRAFSTTERLHEEGTKNAWETMARTIAANDWNFHFRVKIYAFIHSNWCKWIVCRFLSEIPFPKYV